jgi:hypothetical protein
MLEFQLGFFNIAGHGHVDGACLIVPFEGHAEVAFARPFGGDVVQVLEGSDQVNQWPKSQNQI